MYNAVTEQYIYENIQKYLIQTVVLCNLRS